MEKAFFNFSAEFLCPEQSPTLYGLLQYFEPTTLLKYEHHNPKIKTNNTNFHLDEFLTLSSFSSS